MPLQTTGTITLNGQEYTWSSPRLKYLVEVEQFIGPITALATVNSVRGRAYLAYACLRENHPDLTPNTILDWPASAFSEIWPMIAAAIPIYGGGAGGQAIPPAERESTEQETSDPKGSVTPSSSPSSEEPAGIPSAPGGNG